MQVNKNFGNEWWEWALIPAPENDGNNKHPIKGHSRQLSELKLRESANEMLEFIRTFCWSQRPIIQRFKLSLGCHWALQLALLTPYVQELGIPHAWSSITWLCSPLSGLSVQPLASHMSDRRTSKFGRWSRSRLHLKNYKQAKLLKRFIEGLHRERYVKHVHTIRIGGLYAQKVETFAGGLCDSSFVSFVILHCRDTSLILVFTYLFNCFINCCQCFK
ncbi:hypothetical protein LguiA_004292 [Lonicera macranthoides]